MNFAEPKLIQIPIQFNSSYCGMALNAIQLPYNCHCLGLTREKRLILASDNPTICCGDSILAIALNSTIAPELETILKKTHPVSWSYFRENFPRAESDLFTEDFLTQLCCQD